MNWEQEVEHVAAQARAERTPRMDVAQSVVSILTTGQARPLAVAETLWLWLAAVSSAIAVSAATVALVGYTRPAGPLSQIAEAISWAIQ